MNHSYIFHVRAFYRQQPFLVVLQFSNDKFDLYFASCLGKEFATWQQFANLSASSSLSAISNWCLIKPENSTHICLRFSSHISCSHITLTFLPDMHFSVRGMCGLLPTFVPSESLLSMLHYLRIISAFQ